MAAEQVALLDDIEPPPYAEGTSNVQDRVPYTSTALGEAGNNSGQPAGIISPNQHGYLPPQQYSYPPYHLQQPIPNAVTTQNVMVMQSGGTTVVPAVYPDDNSVYAWFVCLCCFWPLGIIAIIHANRARDAIASGDYVTAMTESKASRKFSYWAIGVHFIGLVIGIPLIVVYFILSAAHTV